jgi:iron complex outermembrane receptor protein
MNTLRKLAPAILITTAASLLSLPGLAQDTASNNQSANQPLLLAQAGLEEIIVTAARREQNLQEVPIPVTVVTGDFVADSGSFNVNRLKEMIPTLQFYSSNPRNTTINIRGFGSPYGLTNDGIEQGVGVYVDGVFYPRPASGTFDFLDIERIEVLRGPQGTLYGKNTTAGALNITTRKPSFDPELNFETSFGNTGYVQAKAAVTGPITDNLAGRLSFSGTQRDGVIYNVATQDDLNDLNNLGFKSQLLFNASENLEVLLAGDYTRQRPEGYAQVPAGIAPTQRSAARQLLGILADPIYQGYQPPSYNAFDRLTDTDSPWRSHQNLGGVSLTLNWDVGPGTLTSITAWRLWDWDPSNDRDFLGLPVTTISAAPSKQRQWTQEFRFSGELSDSVHFVAGVFGITQHLYSDPFHVQEVGSAAPRFNLDPSTVANQTLINTPGLVDGYGYELTLDLESDSAAAFGQLDWAITDRLHILPGLRYNYDKKTGFNTVVPYGVNPNPVLAAGQRTVQSVPPSYTIGFDTDNIDPSDNNLSYNLTVSYALTDAINSYATYATSFKPFAVDLSGGGAISAPPEDVEHFEAGLKTQLFDGVTANFAAFQTSIKDFQLTVQDPLNVTAVRGILGSAPKVRNRGLEFDASWQINDQFRLHGAGAYADGEYLDFANAPLPLELTGLRIAAGTEVVYAGDGLYQYQAGTTTATAANVAGGELPGLSKWSFSGGGEYTFSSNFLGQSGDVFIAVDGSYRSKYSSSPTPSAYLNIPGYGLINARIGFRGENGWDVYLWSRNLADKDYYDIISASGGSGLYVGLPGDERSYGVTVRGSF